MGEAIDRKLACHNPVGVMPTEPRRTSVAELGGRVIGETPTPPYCRGWLVARAWRYASAPASAGSAMWMPDAEARGRW
jgi:hypothetical protein